MYRQFLRRANEIVMNVFNRAFSIYPLNEVKEVIERANKAPCRIRGIKRKQGEAEPQAVV
ncbi:MAG: hypothetical protein H6999_09290 [Hahellaceae bacterium]|nr:hypothetical protein [Hahellaceae bacterium]MCP5169936.1 hypothetical protein [Hahellaceae bacterium]